MQRAMARQAEAERERRAKVINAEGEFQAADKLADAAAIISREPSALQLRYLQTLLEIGVDQNSTIVFPLPLDLIEPLLDRAAQRSEPSATACHDRDLERNRRPATPRPTNRAGCRMRRAQTREVVRRVRAARE
jgi:hypothetical protein